MFEESRAATATGDYLRATIEHALGDFSLQVEFSLNAPWTILFGPSGAGKTSLLRILAGLTRPDKGRVLLQGQALVETAVGSWTPPAQRGIGFVTQRPALFPHLNVTENVSFGLSGMTPRAVKGRVAEMLALFHAGHLAGRSPAELSGGERQRVALARALAPGPRLLLLDEPFTGLDSDMTDGILKEVSEYLAERSIPAIYVSHDVAEAFQTQADVLVMDRGKVQARGPAQVVLSGQRLELLRQLGASMESA